MSVVSLKVVLGNEEWDQAHGPFEFRLDDLWESCRRQLCSIFSMSDPSEFTFIWDTSITLLSSDDKRSLRDLIESSPGLDSIDKLEPLQIIQTSKLSEASTDFELSVILGYELPARVSFKFRMDDLWEEFRGRICESLHISDPSEHTFIWNDARVLLSSDDKVNMGYLIEMCPGGHGVGALSPLRIVRTSTLHERAAAAPVSRTHRLLVKHNRVKRTIECDALETWGVVVHRICAELNIVSTFHNFVLNDIAVCDRDWVLSDIVRKVGPTLEVNVLANASRGGGMQGGVGGGRVRRGYSIISWSEPRGAELGMDSGVQLTYNVEESNWGDVLSMVRVKRGMMGFETAFNFYKKVGSIYRPVVVHHGARMSTVESIYGVLIDLKLRREAVLEDSTYAKARGALLDVAWADRQVAILALATQHSSLLAMEKRVKKDAYKLVEAPPAILRLHTLLTTVGAASRPVVTESIACLESTIVRITEEATLPHKLRGSIDKLEKMIAYLSSDAATCTDEEDLRRLNPLAIEYRDREVVHVATGGEGDARLDELERKMAPIRASLAGRLAATRARMGEEVRRGMRGGLKQ